ncbi:sensor histidine kinase [Aeromicrobium sp.]|uniref:sensor histidine kinase n=1 Tax=Aeromicrobium sp. TaxID=1871063 RepID=UPI002FC6F4CA
MTPLRWTFLADLGIVALLTAAMVLECLISDKPQSDVTPATLTVMVLTSMPVVFRRTHPTIAVFAAMGALFAAFPVLHIYQTLPFPTMVAGYSLALHAGRRRVIHVGIALVPFVLLAIAIFSPHGLIDFETPKNLALVGLPLLLGVAIKDRRAYLATLVDRAETAERTREEETLRRVSEERLRIARDVHDVVAHAMVAINVQAGVGAHLIDQDHDRARETLLDIKRVSGEALTDLRSTLGILRTTADDIAPVSPTDGIDDLEELGTTLRAAGISVELDIDPAIATLPASIGATGYRIVQEALTNVLRHAGSSHAVVSVRRLDGDIVIDVLDDGPGVTTSSTGSGNGVRGMRERALALGGTLEAGPGSDGGWRVHAQIPIAVKT